VASLLVVLFHMAGVMGLHKYFGVKFGEIFGFGDAGVEFFFVLSGFITTWVHTPDLGRPAKLVPYLRKRVVRIYPAYSIIFAVTFLMMFCFDRNSVRLPVLPGSRAR